MAAQSVEHVLVVVLENSADRPNFTTTAPLGPFCVGDWITINGGGFEGEFLVQDIQIEISLATTKVIQTTTIHVTSEDDS